jgi:UPF0716 protein FxsA
MTLARLFLLLTILPLVELALLLLMGRYISVWFTLAFVIVTGIVGAILLRYQGLQTFRNIQLDLEEKRMPTDSLLDGLFLFIAAVLLILPGVTTDIVGLTILIPPVRKLYKLWLVRWFKAKFKLQGFAPPGRTQVIDSRIVDASSRED